MMVVARGWRMRRWTFLFLIGVFAIYSLVAIGQEARFRSVAPSPLKRSVFVAPNETRFAGSAEVAGDFEVLWEPESEGFGGGFRVVFKPDAQSRRILPHDVERGAVREVWLRNTEKAISALISPAQRKAIIARRQGLTGHATIVITSYRTGIDCDQRDYNALFVSVVRPATDVSNAARADDAFTC